mmetsp:Transcript_36063/g.82129  ORF Transcript_36063/g.82129 Transcript_36063/m.82129 type:complete len:218 (-) Transcript_36063:80-733(-)
MVQCPLTSTWLNMFWKFCIQDGQGIAEIVDFREYFVGGKEGGKVTNVTWNTSFHGPQEIVGDKFHLCARSQANANETSLSANHTWLDFEACMNGKDGLAIADIPKDAEKCARELGLDFPELSACANGEEGTKMYYDSVWHTSNSGVRYVGPSIPVIHINGQEFKGITAYEHLSERICGAYKGPFPPGGCRCGTKLESGLAAFLASSEALSRATGIQP